MNNLSWLLYGADALENIRVIAGIAAFVLAFAAFGCGLFGGFLAMDEEENNKPLSAAKTFALWLIVPALVLAIAPSRNTIMLIAASEVGETVLATDDAKAIGGEAGALAVDSLKVLRNFINEQLEPTGEPQ